jgi:endonuclease/exonuclease/phosphatase family metal-dependent hydrolase
MWGCRIIWLLLLASGLEAAEFSVATYNVRNYLVRPAAGRKVKPEAQRERVAEVLVRLGAEILALQELGGEDALSDLGSRLARRGARYPHRAMVAGRDPAIRLAVLSRFPLLSVRAHTNDQFLVEESRQWVRRGFLEAEIEIAGGYRFVLLVAHLKSRRVVAHAPEAELRKQEAVILRRRLETLLGRRPGINLLVAGDLNDEPDSTALRIVKGRGHRTLADLAPPARAMDGGDPEASGNWTHFYQRGRERKRLDYLLVSPGMVPELVWEGVYTGDLPHWFEASDHRPLVARFRAEDR